MLAEVVAPPLTFKLVFTVVFTLTRSPVANAPLGVVGVVGVVGVDGVVGGGGGAGVVVEPLTPFALRTTETEPAVDG